MKSKLLPIFSFGLFVTLFTMSCDHSDDDSTPFTEKNINDFVWKGLNSWYYWQEDVPNLADEVGTAPSYIELVNSYQDPTDLFYFLLNDYPNTDRFSWIVTDYNQLLSAFQGTSYSFGFGLGLAKINETSNEVVAYVEYVIPNSQSAIEGFQRGDFFTRVNGATLTLDNYADLLYGETTYSVELCDFVNDEFIPNGTIKTVFREVLTENPVLYKNVYDSPDGKVGYLVYNGFVSSFNQELNDAFAYFQSENITRLILDLRYNGGGSVRTATYLASMILGANNEAVFAELQFNSKHEESNTYYRFTSEYIQYDSQGNQQGTSLINAVQIPSVVVLTTYSTASASELIINGLSAFIEVYRIGTTTRGKDVGSITLFDSPMNDFLSIEEANPNHQWAMQPITFKTFNANGVSDYSNGFTPNLEINELQHIEGFLPFGDTQETLLAAALAYYGAGHPTQIYSPQNSQKWQEIGTLNESPLHNEMYVEPSE